MSWIYVAVSGQKARTVARAGDEPSPHYKDGNWTVQENLSAKCWIGIDVAKPWVDVEILVEEQKKEAFRVERTSEALEELAQRLLPYCPQGVVLEATGGLETLVVATLSAAGLKVMRLNPKRVRDFARAQVYWPKPMPSMPTCWPCLARACSPNCGPGQRSSASNERPGSRGNNNLPCRGRRNGLVFIKPLSRPYARAWNARSPF